MSALAPLLAELAELRRAVEDEDWPLAATLARRHDHALRAAVRDGVADELAALLAAQQALIADFARRREEAAERLRGLRRADGAARAYRDGGEP
ncbi:hypothetical protein [Rehaibacterium terrae]|jgi:hypothetical protein|uniref:Flagellar protein FliT n=1 Tax=Rehaibacterium terrae TaxID=1341696 RepID=A0A7W8DFJ1_9GAMM|nr:hypothetical protein [Rehaibacterium terrae]MBB5016488.1 hypothetical protein [Rehaibacterium terrae]